MLLLFDEVSNLVNRHRDRADSFHAFIQKLTVAVTAASGARPSSVCRGAKWK